MYKPTRQSTILNSPTIYANKHTLSTHQIPECVPIKLCAKLLRQSQLKEWSNHRIDPRRAIHNPWLEPDSSDSLDRAPWISTRAVLIICPNDRVEFYVEELRIRRNNYCVVSNVEILHALGWTYLSQIDFIIIPLMSADEVPNSRYMELLYREGCDCTGRPANGQTHLNCSCDIVRDNCHTEATCRFLKQRKPCLHTIHWESVLVDYLPTYDLDYAHLAYSLQSRDRFAVLESGMSFDTQCLERLFAGFLSDILESEHSPGHLLFSLINCEFMASRWQKFLSPLVCYQMDTSAAVKITNYDSNTTTIITENTTRQLNPWTNYPADDIVRAHRCYSLFRHNRGAITSWCNTYTNLVDRAFVELFGLEHYSGSDTPLEFADRLGRSLDQKAVEFFPFTMGDTELLFLTRPGEDCVAIDLEIFSKTRSFSKSLMYTLKMWDYVEHLAVSLLQAGGAQKHLNLYLPHAKAMYILFGTVKFAYPIFVNRGGGNYLPEVRCDEHHIDESAKKLRYGFDVLAHPMVLCGWFSKFLEINAGSLC